ncbi:hypothetical protein MAR_023916 [Mya arenaria]|uniref:Uncharacterized protein n=1 Tax=Mya arenaria TaxID=6604 RepID=A0ABY7DQZ9_MYAAR|nr:hypothetical protein MAR_023916 [Mya arenaria]
MRSWHILINFGSTATVTMPQPNIEMMKQLKEDRKKTFRTHLDRIKHCSNIQSKAAGLLFIPESGLTWADKNL